MIDTRAGAPTADKADNMSRKLDIASAIAVASTLGFTLLSADGSGAVAQDRAPVALSAPTLDQTSATLQAAGPLAAATGTPESILPETDTAVAPHDSAPARGSENGLTLAQLVSERATEGEASRELECLAGAVYFEAKSETLEGQLAVGRVVINRAHSGRFPSSYCGVVFQRAQFSFIRGSAMPAINRASAGWKHAVAIARIADEGTWTSSAEGALFFHATRVSPNWRLTRIARVDNHVFYR